MNYPRDQITSPWKYLSLLAILLVSLLSCNQKPEEESKEEFLQKEIPVTTHSPEALAEFQKGVDQLNLGYEQGNASVARIHLDSAIELDPEFALAYVYHSFTSKSNQEFREDTEKAAALMDQVSEGEKIIIRINQTSLTNDAEERLQLYLRLVDSYPESSRAWHLLGGEYRRRNQHEKAREAFQKCIQIAPDWFAGYAGLGFSYLFNDPKDFKKAEEMMRKTRDLRPGDAYAHVSLGDCLRAQNRLGDAKASYSKALEISPSHIMVYLKRGAANSFLGNFTEARQDFQKARYLDEYGNLFRVHHEAFTFVYEGDVDEGLTWLLDQATQLEERGIEDAYINQSRASCLANCWWIAFHFQKAHYMHEVIQKMIPISQIMADQTGTKEALINHQAIIIYWEGLLAASRGEYAIAVAKAEENAEILQPIKDARKLENHHFLLGYAHFRQRKYEEALDHFDQANADWIYTQYQIAKTLEATGDYQLANEIYRRIVDYNFSEVGYAVIRNELQSKIKESGF